MQAEQRIADPSKLIKLTDVLAIIPVSKSTWWLGVKSGRYPKPVKIELTFSPRGGRPKNSPRQQRSF